MEKYEFLTRTGEGAYGSVWRARDKNTGVMVAVKKMKDVPTNEEEGEIAMREVRVLQLARHINIVNLMEAYRSQSGRLYLVFEYVERTLLQELKTNRGGLSPAATKSFTWQLLQALSYLHRRAIIHRDVKPSNVLISEGGVVKICDFGFARACNNAAADPAYTTYVVTRWYRPPEVLVGDTYGPPVDIWALGCIFAEMLAGRPLFPGKNHHDQLWLILKAVGRMTERQLALLDADPQFECFRLPTEAETEPLDLRLAGVPPAAMQVLRACLDPDPRQRASADELLALPYFQGVSEVLPLADLAAYPDSDMRLRLDRVRAQDQATAAAAATALASALRRPHAPPLPPSTPQAGKPPAPHSVSPPGGSSPPQLHTQPHRTPQLAPSGGPGLPCKASSSCKLDPHNPPVEGAAAQRPPLQRHITAPAGSMAARVLAQPPPHGGAHASGGSHGHSHSHNHHHGHSHSQHSLLPAQQQQRSLPGSQPGSPRAHQQPHATCPGNGGPSHPAPAALLPVRGRSSWRVSGDGSSSSQVEGSCGGPCGYPPAGPRQPPALAVGQSANGAGGMPLLSSSSSCTQVGATGGRPHAVAGESTTTATCAGLQRHTQQRATWTGFRSSTGPGSTGDGSTGGGSSEGGANSSGAAGGCAAQAGPPSTTSQPASSLHNHKPPVTQDPVALPRKKAHSLAGSEALPVANSVPVSIRGAPGGVGGVHGRSFAPPPLYHGAGSAPSGNGIHLTPPPSVFTTTGAASRLNPSPPPRGYGTGLRATNSVPLAPVPCSLPGRASHDGTSVGPAQIPHVTALGSGKPPPPQQPQVAANGAGGGGGGGHTAREAQSAVLELEVSDGSVADGGGGVAGYNDGRRASDTVLYAAAALREAKYRVEKGAHMIIAAVPSRPQLAALDPGGGGAAGGTGAVGAPGLRAPCAPSHGRILAPSGAAAPASPDMFVAAPGPLPPLHGTPPPHRRFPSSDGTAAILQVPAGGVLGAGNGCCGGSNKPRAGASAVSQQAAHGSNGVPHRLSLKPPLVGPSGKGAVTGTVALHPAPPADLADGAECTVSAYAFLPTLEMGLQGKGGRVVSVVPGPVVAVPRRPSKNSLRALGPESSCKREDAPKGTSVVLEAVPEASVL